LEIIQDRTHFISELSKQRLTAILLGLGGVTVASLLIWLVSVGVVRPIKVAAESMHQISSGDGNLAARLDESGADEMSDLAKAFNHFVEKISGTVSEVSSSAEQLAGVVEEVSAVAENTNKDMKQQQADTTQIATAMTEMSATVKSVADNSAMAAEAATQADQQASSGHKVVQDSIEYIRRLADDVERSSNVMKRVSDDSNRIGGVLDVIRGVAEQTNLLALNAAIEAARAGEQGRGFAVVADEVRSLAQRAQESTQEIHQMVDSLQAGVDEAVGVMEESRHRAEESVNQAMLAGDSLRAITQAVETIVAMNTQIATASEEQSVVAEDINRNIVNISHVAEHATNNAELTASRSASLAQHAARLIGIVSSFQTGGTRTALAQAKASHLAWKTMVRRFLDGKSILNKESAFSSHGCAFGKWYDTEGKKALGDNDTFRKIEAPHNELHQTIKKIAELKSSGDIQAAEELYAQITPLSKRVVELIEKLEKEMA
jgi:methyl-accepting chemotaxis protein